MRKQLIHRVWRGRRGTWGSWPSPESPQRISLGKFRLINGLIFTCGSYKIWVILFPMFNVTQRIPPASWPAANAQMLSSPRPLWPCLHYWKLCNYISLNRPYGWPDILTRCVHVFFLSWWAYMLQRTCTGCLRVPSIFSCPIYHLL